MKNRDGGADFFRKALDVSNEKKITDLTSLESIAASSIIWEMVLGIVLLMILPFVIFLNDHHIDRQSEGFKPRTYASNMVCTCTCNLEPE